MRGTKDNTHKKEGREKEGKRKRDGEESGREGIERGRKKRQGKGEAELEE